MGARWRSKQNPDENAQKPRQPAQEEAEVIVDGGEHGIAAVAVAPLEIIAAHAVLGFGVADDRLDGGAALSSRGGSVW